MSETTPLDDFISSGAISLQTGPFGSQLHSYDYVEEGVPVIPTEGIQEGRIDHTVLPKITDEKCTELARHAVVEDDILFARRGAQATGRSALIRESEVGFICGTGAIRARVNDRTVLDPKFLAWFLATPSTVTWIREQAIGATMPNLNKSIIGRIEVPLLPVEEQREIAAVLGALDDKIELNRKTAVTLEAMARALYRSWFVDFDPVHAKSEGRTPAHMPPETAALFPARFGEDGLPEGWRAGTLGEVATNPKKGAKPSEMDPGTPYIGLEHVPRKSVAIAEWGTAADITSNKTCMKKGQFLFGKLRPYFHKVGIAPADGVCSTDILVVDAVERLWRPFVLSVISSDELVAHTTAVSNGARMPRAKWQDLSDFEITVPTQDIAAAFRDATGALHEKILATVYENQALANLRDTLLPRLMSGDLRVGAAREQVEDVA